MVRVVHTAEVQTGVFLNRFLPNPMKK